MAVWGGEADGEGFGGEIRSRAMVRAECGGHGEDDVMTGTSDFRIGSGGGETEGGVSDGAGSSKDAEAGVLEDAKLGNSLDDVFAVRDFKNVRSHHVVAGYNPERTSGLGLVLGAFRAALGSLGHLHSGSGAGRLRLRGNK